MALIDCILFGIALGAAIFALCGDKIKIHLIILSYVCFALSPLTDFIDIIDRAEAGDIGGILDIYPTFFWCYLALLTGITATNIINIFLKTHRRVVSKEL